MSAHKIYLLLKFIGTRDIMMIHAERQTLDKEGKKRVKIIE